MKKFLVTSVLSLLLIGCSGGPGNSDIEAALKAEVVDGVKAMLKMTNSLGALGGQKPKEFDPDSIDVDVTSVDNMKETEDGAYTATVSMEATIEMDGKEETSASVLQVVMREADGEWILEKQRKIK